MSVMPQSVAFKIYSMCLMDLLKLEILLASNLIIPIECFPPLVFSLVFSHEEKDFTNYFFELMDGNIARN